MSASDVGGDLRQFRSGPFVPILARSDVFIRPTNTNGDASSLREALWLGLPSVASDVAERPEPALTFRSRDLDDLERQTRAALAEAPRPVDRDRPRLPDKDQERVDRYIDLLVGLATR